MKRLGKALFSSLGDLRDVQVMAEWVARLSEPDNSVRQLLIATLGQKESQLKAAAQEALAQLRPQAMDCAECALSDGRGARSHWKGWCFSISRWSGG